MAEGRDQLVTGVATTATGGGRPSGTPHDGEGTEQGEGRGDVPEDGALTLSMVGRSVEAEVDGRRRNRGGGAADGGEGDETDASM